MHQRETEAELKLEIAIILYKGRKSVQALPASGWD